MNYRLAYAVGFHPWEDAAEDPPFVDRFRELLDKEEAGNTAPFGSALDLGTGSAIWSIELARRGWQVTGVDNVERALERGRDRVRDANVEMQLVHGDVTDLQSSNVGTNFRLLLDTGTFHGLTDDDRIAMGKQVTAVAAPRRNSLPPGLAPSASAADQGRQPRRGRGSIPRLGDHRYGALVLQATPRTAVDPSSRRTLVQAASRCLTTGHRLSSAVSPLDYLSRISGRPCSSSRTNHHGRHRGP